MFRRKQSKEPPYGGHFGVEAVGHAKRVPNPQPMVGGTGYTHVYEDLGLRVFIAEHHKPRKVGFDARMIIQALNNPLAQAIVLDVRGANWQDAEGCREFLQNYLPFHQQS